MTESQFTQRLLIDLRSQLPGGIIYKHSDRFTTGMPDFSASAGGHTVWCEVKLTGNPRIFEPIQLMQLKVLHGYYVIFNPRTRLGTLFAALQVPTDAPCIPASCARLDMRLEDLVYRLSKLVKEAA